MRCKSKADMWVKEYRAKQRRECWELLKEFLKERKVTFNLKFLNFKEIEFKISVKAILIGFVCVSLLLVWLLIKWLFCL